MEQWKFLCLESMRSIFPVPLMKRLVCWGWYLAVTSPDIEVVIDGEARQYLKCRFSRLRRNPVSFGMAQQLTGNNHSLLLQGRRLVLFIHHSTPGVDLFVNVDLYRADVCAASVQGRSKRELAVAVDFKRRHRNDADWPHVS